MQERAEKRARDRRAADGRPDRMSKRVLEYGVRAFVFYGNLRGEIAFREHPQEYCFVLTETFGNLRKPPGVYRRM